MATLNGRVSRRIEDDLPKQQTNHVLQNLMANDPRHSLDPDLHICSEMKISFETKMYFS